MTTPKFEKEAEKVVEVYKSKWSIVHDKYVEERLFPLVLEALQRSYQEGVKDSAKVAFEDDHHCANGCGEVISEQIKELLK